MATNNQINLGLSGSTGTGTFVGSTSPTIVTPRIGTINDTNGLAVLTFLPVGSAVNSVEIFNNATLANPGILSIGSDTNVGMTIATKGTGTFLIQTAALTNQFTFASGTSSQHNTIFNLPSTSANRTVTFPDADGTLLMTGQAISTVPSIAFSSTSGVIGTTTNDSAAALSVGQIISSVVADSTVSLTSNTSADATSISLTAGDWDVWGNVAFNGAAGTLVIINIGWISTTSATLPASNLYATQFFSGGGTAIYAVAPSSFCVPAQRISLSGTTTVYLSARSAFSVSTSTVGGAIYARRRR